MPRIDALGQQPVLEKGREEIRLAATTNARDDLHESIVPFPQKKFYEVVARGFHALKFLTFLSKFYVADYIRSNSNLSIAWEFT